MKKRKIAISVLRSKMERNEFNNLPTRVVAKSKKDKDIARQFNKILAAKFRIEMEILMKEYEKSIIINMPFEDQQ